MNYIYRFIFIFIVILLCTFIYNFSNFKNKPNINKIANKSSKVEECEVNLVKMMIIKKVDFSIYTITNVACNDFERVFYNEIKIKEVKDLKSICDLNVMLSNLQILGPGFENYTLDTRVVIEQEYKNGKKRIICLSNVACSIDSKLYYVSDKLRCYLENI